MENKQREWKYLKSILRLLNKDTCLRSHVLFIVTHCTVTMEMLNK